MWFDSPISKVIKEIFKKFREDCKERSYFRNNLCPKNGHGYDFSAWKIGQRGERNLFVALSVTERMAGDHPLVMESVLPSFHQIAVSK